MWRRILFVLSVLGCATGVPFGGFLLLFSWLNYQVGDTHAAIACLVISLVVGGVPLALFAVTVPRTGPTGTPGRIV